MSGILLSLFSGAPPTFAVSPSTASVNEGSSVTFTVTTTNVPDATTLYWSLNTVSGTVNTSDFTGAAVTGSFTITSGSGSVALTLANDVTTEGSESFQLQVRTGSTSGTIVATSSTVTIDDTSLSPPPVQIQFIASTYNVPAVTGATSTLSWNVTNSANVSINGGNVGTSGSMDVGGSPFSTQTYTLTALDSNGSPSSVSLSIYFEGCGPGLIMTRRGCF